MTHKNLSGNESFWAVNVGLFKAPSPSGHERNYMFGKF